MLWSITPQEAAILPLLPTLLLVSASRHSCLLALPQQQAKNKGAPSTTWAAGMLRDGGRKARIAACLEVGTRDQGWEKGRMHTRAFFGGGRWGLGTSVLSAPLKPELGCDEEEGLVGAGCGILAVG